MKTIKFNYVKKDGSESQRELFGAKIVKEVRNDLELLEDENAKYVIGWELDEVDMTDEQKQLYKDTIKDYFYEVAKLENYLRENNLDASKVKFKTFLKEGIKNIIIS
jgi:hypothetical protein